MIRIFTIAATARDKMSKPIIGDERVRTQADLFTSFAGNILMYVGITDWLSPQLYHIQKTMATMINLFVSGAYLSLTK